MFNAARVKKKKKKKKDVMAPSHSMQRQVGHRGASGREESSTKHGLLKAVK
jgi:hypothetical protein